MIRPSLILKNKDSSINPFWVSGLTDGDGSFWVTVTKSKTTKTGWAVSPYFSIAAANNPPNLDMLNGINQYWGEIGRVRLKHYVNSEGYELEVVGLKNCLILRDHFNKYPLFTYKLVHFQLWSKILTLMQEKQHLNVSGLSEIIGIKTHFKKGLSPLLISSFINPKETIKPSYNPDFQLMNNQWLAGFINSDGHFGLYLTRPKEDKPMRIRCEAQFNLVQLNSSRIVLEYIVNFLGFGTVYPLVPNASLRNNASAIQFSNIKYINKLIYILEGTQFHGVKALDYQDFCEAVEIINTKAHLREEGLLKIEAIANKLNKNRTF